MILESSPTFVRNNVCPHQYCQISIIHGPDPPRSPLLGLSPSTWRQFCSQHRRYCYIVTAALQQQLNLHTSAWSLEVSPNLRDFHNALSTCYSGHHASCHLLHLRQRLRHPQHRHPPPQLRQEVGDRAGGWPCRDTTVPTVSEMIRLAICIPPNASTHLQNSKCI